MRAIRAASCGNERAVSRPDVVLVTSGLRTPEAGFARQLSVRCIGGVYNAWPFGMAAGAVQRSARPAVAGWLPALAA